MGAIGDRVRGLLFLLRYFGGWPRTFRKMAAAGDAEGVRKALRAFADQQLDQAGIDVVVTGSEKVPASGYVLTYNECAIPDFLVNQGRLWELCDLGVTVPMWKYFPGFQEASKHLGLEILPKGRPAVDALMNRFAEAARNGSRIMWGGEGGLSGMDGVKPFKTGAARIAIRAQVPVVPVAVRGGQLLMPLGGLRLRPGTLRMAIGEPIPTEGLTEDDVKELTKRVQTAVEQLFSALPAG